MILTTLLLCLGLGCGREGTPSRKTIKGDGVEESRTALDDRPTILFFGTSLTAGLGLEPDEAYPALIQRKLDSAGLAFRAVNAGVSGETSAAGLRRIDWLLVLRLHLTSVLRF